MAGKAIIRKLHFEDTPTGYPPHEDAIIKECVKQFQQALCLKFKAALNEKEESESASVGLSFTFTIQTAAKSPVVKGAMVVKRPSLREETQGVVGDPAQQKLIEADGEGA